MKKFAIPAILILVALGAYLLFGKGQSPANQQADLQSNGQEESFTGSLVDAVRRGVGMKCTYSVDGAEYEGFVKGKNYRGTMNYQGKVSEVIMKDDCMWVWSDQDPQGMKICYESEEADASLWGEPTDTEVSGTAPNVQYKCVPAVISESEFNPPSDIQFLDFEQMMQGGLPSGY